MATMQAVMLTRKGGLEVLETVELPLPEPGPGEVRVKVRATGVGLPISPCAAAPIHTRHRFPSCPATSRSASSTPWGPASPR
jgi:hypothetical protein